jgi:hypothetical protein
MNTKTFLKTLLEGKGISEEHTFEIKSDGIYGNHHVPMEVVIEFIDSLELPLQYVIRRKLMRIDFKNGDILNFLQYITKGMVELQFSEND